MVFILMSAFVVALCLDEYNDSRRAMEDLRIEACAELEAEDFEWDESDGDNGMVFATVKLDMPPSAVFTMLDFVRSVAYQTDDQRLGLVRRYATRKGIARANYILT